MKIHITLGFLMCICKDFIYGWEYMPQPPAPNTIIKPRVINAPQPRQPRQQIPAARPDPRSKIQKGKAAAPKREDYLRERIDPLIKDIIGLRSSISSMSNSIHGLLTNIHSINADIKGLRTKSRSYATNIKGLEEHARSSASEFKRFNSRIRSNTETIKEIRSHISAMKRSNIGSVSKRSTITYPSTATEWRKETLINEPVGIKKGQLLNTIDTIDKEYKLSFDFKGPKMGHYGNIIHFTVDGDDNNKYGDCIPCIYYNGGMLEVSSAVNGNAYFYKTAQITPNDWHNIELTQEKEVNSFVYTILVDGKVITKMTNTKPAVFHKVKVFISDPWYAVQNGYLRNAYLSHKAKKINSARTYYDEYNALFAGFGYSASSTGQQKLSMGHTLEECLLICYSKSEADTKWNGVRYDSLTKDCYCIQNSQGHIKTKTDLHYNFLN